MHDVTLESGAAVTDHIADAFVREKFDFDAILFGEIKCKRKDI